MASLIRRDGDALHVLLDRRPDHVVDGPVVAEVDHLDALRLEDPPHDVDGGVVPVEQAGGSDEADGVLGRVGHRVLETLPGRDHKVDREPAMPCEVATER